MTRRLRFVFRNRDNLGYAVAHRTIYSQKFKRQLAGKVTYYVINHVLL